MDEAARFRRIFRRVHASHPACLRDEWLGRPCADAHDRVLDRPIAWSRRNGPWHTHDLLFVGAAPGNAGGRGGGELGAHGTRIPFGGDIAGANLDVLLGSIGVTRNDIFITAALNHLPLAGGGEPTLAELQAPVGEYTSSIHLLRDTIIACRPRLIVALGHVGLRATAAAAQLEDDEAPVRLPPLARLQRAGIERGRVAPAGALPVSAHFQQCWRGAWREDAAFRLVLLTHPSAQNMSPFARVHTAFHTRMIEARAALRAAALQVLHREPPAERPALPADGIYALREWRELVAPRHQRLDQLWREKGL